MNICTLRLISPLWISCNVYKFYPAYLYLENLHIVVSVVPSLEPQEHPTTPDPVGGDALFPPSGYTTAA